MLAMLRDLIQHQGCANAALLRAIRNHARAAEDVELRKLLHHIILANRFWLMLTLDRPFALEQESQVPESLRAIAKLFQETHILQAEWIAQAREADLMRALETPFIAGYKFSVAQAFMQVCMHTHGHRAQCASKLRIMGGTPPTMDFILWLKERLVPDWS